MSEANKALVRRWFAELDKRNLNIVDELVAADYIDHNPPIPDLAPGREGMTIQFRLIPAFLSVVYQVQRFSKHGESCLSLTHIPVCFG